MTPRSILSVLLLVSQIAMGCSNGTQRDDYAETTQLPPEGILYFTSTDSALYYADWIMVPEDLQNGVSDPPILEAKNAVARGFELLECMGKPVVPGFAQARHGRHFWEVSLPGPRFGEFGGYTLFLEYPSGQFIEHYGR